MGLFGGYSYKNKKGEKFYLHMSEKKRNIYYFSKDPAGSIDLPIGYEVVESPRTGLPVLRKIGKK
jgi:hypothetical protein